MDKKKNENFFLKLIKIKKERVTSKSVWIRHRSSLV